MPRFQTMRTKLKWSNNGNRFPKRKHISPETCSLLFAWNLSFGKFSSVQHFKKCVKRFISFIRTKWYPLKMFNRNQIVSIFGQQHSLSNDQSISLAAFISFVYIHWMKEARKASFVQSVNALHLKLSQISFVKRYAR